MLERTHLTRTRIAYDAVVVDNARLLQDELAANPDRSGRAGPVRFGSLRRDAGLTVLEREGGVIGSWEKTPQAYLVARTADPDGESDTCAYLAVVLF